MGRRARIMILAGGIVLSPFLVMQAAAAVTGTSNWAKVVYGANVDERYDPTSAHVSLNVGTVTMDSTWSTVNTNDTAELSVDITLANTGGLSTAQFGQNGESHVYYEALSETLLEYSWDLFYGTDGGPRDSSLFWYLQQMKIRIYDQMNNSILHRDLSGFPQANTRYTGTDSFTLGPGTYSIILYELGIQGGTQGPIWWNETGSVSLCFFSKPGDLDADGDVDLDDFIILKSNFGVGAVRSQGDLDGDGDVDLDDFIVLKGNFGTDVVPEPTTLLLMALAGLAAIARPR